MLCWLRLFTDDNFDYYWFWVCLIFRIIYSVYESWQAFHFSGATFVWPIMKYINISLYFQMCSDILVFWYVCIKSCQIVHLKTVYSENDQKICYALIVYVCIVHVFCIKALLQSQHGKSCSPVFKSTNLWNEYNYGNHLNFRTGFLVRGICSSKSPKHYILNYCIYSPLPIVGHLFAWIFPSKCILLYFGCPSRIQFTSR